MKTDKTRQHYLRKLEERWDKMTITSDPLFGLVMENEQICHGLIQRAIPEITVTKIKRIETQKDISSYGLDRKVRYDVYVEDDRDRIYVIEMQMVSQHNLPARLRYYQEQIDSELLMPGDDYQKLLNYPTYVIMFCNFDYFQRGWAKYQFDFACTRDRQLKLGDNRTVVVFNATANTFAEDEPMRNFLQLMRNQVVANDNFVQTIQNEIKKIKQSPERRRGFMKFELDLMDARREGIEMGIRELIQSLRQANFPDDDIRKSLMNGFHLTAERAQEYLHRYW